MRGEAVGHGGDSQGAPKAPVLPFCLFREHSKPRGWVITFPRSLQADPCQVPV